LEDLKLDAGGMIVDNLLSSGAGKDKERRFLCEQISELLPYVIAHSKLALLAVALILMHPQPIVPKQLPKKDSSGIYQENGDYQKDIEINHLRNRYTLTKGAFQKNVGSTLCHALPTDTTLQLQPKSSKSLMLPCTTCYRFSHFV
jgi:hypothetical protein